MEEVSVDDQVHDLSASRVIPHEDRPVSLGEDVDIGPGCIGIGNKISLVDCVDVIRIGGAQHEDVTVGAFDLATLRDQIAALKAYVDAQHVVINELWKDKGKPCIGCLGLVDVKPFKGPIDDQ